MLSREEFHEILCTALGSRYVYYQPPENFKMVYPAIIYERNKYNDLFADNNRYLSHKAYKVTLISKTPDNPKIDEIRKIKFCSFDRSYISDNLYHDVFTIYT